MVSVTIEFSELLQCYLGLCGLSGGAGAPIGPCWLGERVFPKLGHWVSLREGSLWSMGTKEAS